jgi:hypothetical protein
MLAHCINQDCREQVRSLAEGRLFQFEIVSISLSADDDCRDSTDETPRSETAQFWLCNSCAEAMTLTLEPAMGLKILPLADLTPTVAGLSPAQIPPFLGDNSC